MMRGFWNFFHWIVCINLDSRKDRWKVVQKELDNVGLKGKYERISGIPNEEGIVGCTQTHVSIIRKARKRNLRNVLIFEDDVKFVNFDARNIKGAIRELRKVDWDLFYLGSSSNCNLYPYGRYLAKGRGFKTTHAYAVNSSAFDKILTNNWIWRSGYKEEGDVKLSTHIDKFYREEFVDRNIFHINPIQCVQRKSYSDIKNREVDYESWQVERFKARLEHTS